METPRRDYEDLYEKALLYSKEKQFHEAADLLRQILDKYNPNDEQALQLLIHVLIQLRKYDEARLLIMRTLDYFTKRSPQQERITKSGYSNDMDITKMLQKQLQEIEKMMDKGQVSERKGENKREKQKTNLSSIQMETPNATSTHTTTDKWIQDDTSKFLKEAKAQQEKSTSTSPHATTDKWTLDDTLGYGLYAYSIYSFLTHKETRPPLAISIQAPWGGGKTSIMRMIQKHLDPKSPDLQEDKKMDDSTTESIQKDQAKAISVKEILSNKKKNGSENQYEIKDKPRMLTIWFNAWKYQSAEQIWAGLANAIITKFSERLKPEDKRKFLLELNSRRVGKDTILSKVSQRVFSLWWKKIRKWCWTYLTGIGSSAIWFFLETTDLVTFFDEEFGSLAVALFAMGGAGIIALQRNEAVAAVEKEDASEVLGEFIRIPDYSQSLGFIHHVDADMRRVLSIIAEQDLNLVVFIDDLDRCSPSNIIKVVEGVNMFISAEYKNCFLIVGMDTEIVAAALEKAHSDVIEKLPTYSKTGIGWRYMDKFVQLPVIIPPPDKRNLLHYTYSLFVLSDNNAKEHQAIEDVAKKIQLQENFSEESIKNEIKSYGVTNDLQEIVMRGVIAKQTQQQISQAYTAIDAKKVSYSDSNVEVIDQAMKAVSSFSNNPREMKRFLNVLRFSYFIREGRKTLRLGIPTIDQLTQWLILTMKWPHLVLWLHKRSGGIADDKKLESRTQEILKTLEDASAKDIDTWTREIRTQFNIKSDIDDDKLSWLYDENLKNFFAEERKLTSPLSEAPEKGLY